MSATLYMIEARRAMRRAETARKHAALLAEHKRMAAARKRTDDFFARIEADLVPEAVLDEDYEDELLKAAAELGIDLSMAP